MKRIKWTLLAGTMLTFVIAVSAQAEAIRPLDIYFSSSTGVSSVHIGSFDDLFADNGIGVGFFSDGSIPTATWNLVSAYDIDELNYRSIYGSNAQGAVSGFRMNFYSGIDGTGTLINSLNAVQNTPTQLLSWDLSSLSLTGVESIQLEMLTREPIISPSISGNHYELGYMELNGVTTVPVPAAAWLFGSALIGLAGMTRKK